MKKLILYRVDFDIKKSVNIIIFTTATLTMQSRLVHLLKMNGILIMCHICFIFLFLVSLTALLYIIFVTFILFVIINSSRG